MATYSMTGFGHASFEKGGVQIEVEAKSVNHRFLDAVIRLPGVYSRLEPDLQKLAADTLARGRLEITVSRKDQREKAYELQFNQELFRSYLRIQRKAIKSEKLDDKLLLPQAALNLLQRKEILELVPRELDISSEILLVKRAVKSALEDLLEMRKVEGKALEGEMLGQLSALEAVCREISKRAVISVEDFREKLTKRLDKLAPDLKLDPARIAQEAAFLADRADVNEELSRLKSHFAQFRKIFKDGDGGRKLEFLLQEMGREINTTGSKTQDSSVTFLVIDAKALLEKLREQVQNIE